MKKLILLLLAVIVIANIMPGRDKIKDLEALLKMAKGEQKLEILLQLVREYENCSPKGVIDSGLEALALFKQFPDNKRETRLLNGVGLAYIDQGQVDPGLLYLNRSRKLAETTGDREGLADALHSIAAAYMKFGNYDLALEVCRDVLAIRTRLNDSRGIAQTRRTIGRIYSHKGDFEKALEHYLATLDLQEKNQDQEAMAYTYLDIGATYRQMNKYGDAGRYFKLALDIHKKAGNKPGMLLCLNNLAAALRDSAANTMEENLRVSFYRETVNYYRLALQLQKELGFKTDMVLALLNMGEAYEYLKQYDNANECYAVSLGMSRELGEKAVEAQALAHIAVMHGRQNQYRLALDTAGRALEMADALQDKVARKNVYEAIAGLYSGVGNFKQAYTTFQKFKALNDEILNTGSADRLAALDALLNTKEKERQIELLEEREIRHQNLLRFYLVVGVLVLIIAVVNFILYRIKKREEAAVRESEEKYRLLEEERLKRSKFESISLLARGIAHDFNNILGVILGYVDLVKMSLAPRSPQTQHLAKAEQAVSKAKDLAEKFLTFAENGEPIKRAASIPVILEQAVALTLDHPVVNTGILNPEHDLDIKVNIPTNLKAVDCNPDQIKQVLSNLLVNGIEALFPQLNAASADKGNTVSHKGVIEISAENLHLKDRETGDLPAGAYVRLSIRDEGEGIPPENLGKLFDPYFSTRQRVSQKGLGLGLTIVYSIMARHGGHIDISSEPGQGTTVTLYLPALEKELTLPLRN